MKLSNKRMFMGNLKFTLSILFSFFLALVVGVLVYGLLDEARLDLFCPVDAREGSDCYVMGWPIFSEWVVSITGGVVGVVSMCLVAMIKNKQKYETAKYTLIIGSIMAIPFALLVKSIFAYISTVLAAMMVLLMIKYLVRIPK